MVKGRSIKRAVFCTLFLVFVFAIFLVAPLTVSPTRHAKAATTYTISYNLNGGENNAAMV